MKKTILSLVLTAMALGVFAEPVTSEMAVAAANAWAKRNGAFDSGVRATGNVLTVCDTNAASTVLWHQVEMANDRCLIIAPDTEIEPVVCALDNNPGELPQAHPLRGILTGDMRGRLQLLGLYPAAAQSGPSLQSVRPGAVAPTPTVEVAPEVREWGDKAKSRWARLGVGGGPKLQAEVGVNDVPVHVGIADGFEKDGRFTHWDQQSQGGGYCYNYYTPNHAVCGCVATAEAALIQFFACTNGAVGVQNTDCSYNGRPYASYPYNSSQNFSGKAACTIGGKYDWSLFDSCTTRDHYDSLTKAQRELLGRVAFDAAVSVGMAWADEGSGSYVSLVADSLKDVFGFKNARYVSSNDPNHPTDAFLRKLIYGQCAAGAPVNMGIQGHSVLAVGFGIDADSVERVRVFMGWGGSGDGWYALPNIDTKAVAGGSSYLSTIISGVVTMVDYNDDNIVPVVGQVTMGGVSVTFDAVADRKVDEETGEVSYPARVVPTTAEGWFATRVPPSAGTFTFTCCGKQGEYTIGSAARTSTSESQLAPAIPDWLVPFPLLNSTVCFSFESARRAALREGKAILYVSGVSGETNTQMVLNHIFELDDLNTNDFTNRFVYLFAASTRDVGDGIPSYGVFQPSEASADDRWWWENGRLSYGYAREETTNITEEVTNEISGATTEVIVGEETNCTIWTYPVVGDVSTYTQDICPIDDYDTAGTLLNDSFDAVIESGWQQFLLRTSGVVLTIMADGPEIGTPEPGFGVYSNKYVAGETITVSAQDEMTNVTAGVVIGYNGCTLTRINSKTGDISTQDYDGTSATFDVNTNDEVIVTWHTATNAVYIDIGVVAQSKVGKGGTTDPGSGWYPYGERVIFNATPNANYVFESWHPRENNGHADYVAMADRSYVVDAFEPMKLEAIFRACKTPPEPSTNYTVTVVNVKYYTDDYGAQEFDPMVASDHVPDTWVSTGEQVADGDSTDVPNLRTGFAPMARTIVDRDGITWEPTIWVLFEEDVDPFDTITLEAALESAYMRESGSSAQFVPPANCKLVWYWTPVLDDAGGGDNPPPEDVIEIAVRWNHDLDNLHEVEPVVLIDAEHLVEALAAGAQIRWADNPMPNGWKLDHVQIDDASGDLVAYIEMDEHALAPKGQTVVPAPILISAGEEGGISVIADVANGVTGFWYSIIQTDALGSGWTPLASRQAKSDGPFTYTIPVAAGEQKKFYKLVVSDAEKN